MKSTIMRVQTLSLLTRNSGNRLDSLIPDNTDFYLSEIKEFLKEDKIDELDEEFLSQYLQSLLQIIEINIKNSEKTLIQVLKKKNQVQTLKEILNQALHYNPNMPDFLEFEEEEEDEDGMSALTQRTRCRTKCSKTRAGRCAKPRSGYCGTCCTRPRTRRSRST
jgi:hypothetical protein